jgi:prepilin-type N-terminal cleavage/methylation domain-containing protein
MSARTEHRGFSLLELMVASAVGLIILVAAMAAFDLQASFSRHTERLLGAQASSGLGLTMMQRDLENSGLRFRGGAQVDGGVNWAAAVRPYDQLGTNIVDLCNDATCSGSGKVTAPSGTQGGYIAGTDAFEVLLGSRQMDPRRVAAQVGAGGAFGGSTMTITVSPNPFTAQEYVPPAVGSSAPLLMFWSDDVHCMGRVTLSSPVGNAASVTISTVDAKLANSGMPWKPGCPVQGMNVDILQYRHRYLVYQSDSSPRPSRTGLHLQSNPFCDPLDGGTVCSTDLGPPMMVAEGIDDMQVAWRVPEGWGPDGGVWCQKSSVESCDFDKLNNSDGIRAANIIGAQIYLSSHGPEIYKRENEPVPVLFNHTPTPATDSVVRSVMQASVLFRNAVTP